MPSNDERREVAARLRGQKTWDIFTNYEDCIGDLCDAVFEDEGDLNDMFRLQHTLADLIEQEPERTCHVTEEARFTCIIDGAIYTTRFSCGHFMENSVIKNEINFCPTCGARVKEGE